MNSLKCIDKYRNKHGVIVGYQLIDSEENTFEVSALSLKQEISMGKVHVINLTLTSDGRLIDKVESNETSSAINDNNKTIINKAVDDLVYLICKSKKECEYNRQTNSWNKNDIYKAFDILSNLGINIYRLKRVIDLDYKFCYCCGRYLICFTPNGIGVRGYESHYRSYTNINSNKDELFKMIELLMDETNSGIKPVGMLIDKLRYCLLEIAKKAKLSDDRVTVIFNNDGRYVITIMASREGNRFDLSHAFIRPIKINGIMGDTIDYEAYYMNELNEPVTIDVNQLYNTDINLLEPGFRRTIAEAKPKFTLGNWLNFFK